MDLTSGKGINAEKRTRRITETEASNIATLGALVLEYETRFTPSKKIWQPRGPRSSAGAARMVIERVYSDKLGHPVTEIAEDDFAHPTSTYKRA
ncbi:hypothetical protein FGG78_11205 [Thioclava sp. BHET1]|nr:hypothetical protein FGG78_11205 [Thioclava sp. BHET1]